MPTKRLSHAGHAVLHLTSQGAPHAAVPPFESLHLADPLEQELERRQAGRQFLRMPTGSCKGFLLKPYCKTYHRTWIWKNRAHPLEWLKLKTASMSWAWWYTPVIPALRRIMSSKPWLNSHPDSKIRADIHTYTRISPKYTYMHGYIYIGTQINTHAHLHTYMHTYVDTQTYTNVHACTYTHINTHIQYTAPCHCSWEHEMVEPLWKTFWPLNMLLLKELAILLPGIYQRKMRCVLA
jgi:hypothetical protein